MYKNAFNYSGSKDKLLPQILQYFPKNINTFYDVFSGSGVVCSNIDAHKYIANDKCFQLSTLLWIFKNHDTQELLDKIDLIIRVYKLSKTNKDGFLELRKDYNEDPITFEPKYTAPQESRTITRYMMLYCLIMHSYNYLMVFTKDDRFSVPSGAGRSYFNASLRSKFIAFCSRLKEMNIHFGCCDFEDTLSTKMHNNDFVYIDPPYLLSDDAYSRTVALKWTEDHERKLYDSLRQKDKEGIKFAISNIIQHGDKENLILKEFAKDYNIHYLNIDYNNCNHQKIKKETTEVLILNFD